jgi:hypothetical protein
VFEQRFTEQKGWDWVDTTRLDDAPRVRDNRICDDDGRLYEVVTGQDDGRRNGAAHQGFVGARCGAEVRYRKRGRVLRKADEPTIEFIVRLSKMTDRGSGASRDLQLLVFRNPGCLGADGCESLERPIVPSPRGVADTLHRQREIPVRYLG